MSPIVPTVINTLAEWTILLRSSDPPSGPSSPKPLLSVCSVWSTSPPQASHSLVTDCHHTGEPPDPSAITPFLTFPSKMVRWNPVLSLYLPPPPPFPLHSPYLPSAVPPHCVPTLLSSCSWMSGVGSPLFHQFPSILHLFLLLGLNIFYDNISSPQ